MKKSILLALSVWVLFVSAAILITPAKVWAREVMCRDGTTQSFVVNRDFGTPDEQATDACREHGGVGSVPSEGQACQTTDETCLPILRYIQLGINFLAAGVSIIIIIMIIIAGIQYTTANDNAQTVSAAKKKILNAIVALLGLIFLYAFLQWVVPGGIY